MPFACSAPLLQVPVKPRLCLFSKSLNPALSTLKTSLTFSGPASSTTITVTENNHGRTSGDTVRFRNVQGSPGGVAFTAYENSSGFNITVTTTNKYTFTLGSTPSITEDSGGPTVSAGPVTITPW